jgi:uncharacterized membrane protein YvbJ
MKSCFHCGETLADVAYRCTKCGVGISEQVTKIKRTVDLPFGPAMTPLKLASIVVATLMVLALSVGWMFS